MRVCLEHITGLRFKLRMFGVPITDLMTVLHDNLSVVRISSILSSTLNKEHSVIAYNLVR